MNGSNGGQNDATKQPEGKASPWGQIDRRKQEIAYRTASMRNAINNVPQPVQQLLAEAKSRATYADNVTKETFAKINRFASTDLPVANTKTPWTLAKPKLPPPPPPFIKTNPAPTPNPASTPIVTPLPPAADKPASPAKSASKPPGAMIPMIPMGPVSTSPAPKSNTDSKNSTAPTPAPPPAPFITQPEKDAKSSAPVVAPAPIAAAPAATAKDGKAEVKVEVKAAGGKGGGYIPRLAEQSFDGLRSRYSGWRGKVIHEPTTEMLPPIITREAALRRHLKERRLYMQVSQLVDMSDELWLFGRTNTTASVGSNY